MTTPHLHADFVKALKHFAKARGLFETLVKGKLILGNDNHIGDIGEYWVRRYYERLGKFRRYHPNKTGPFDIELKSGKCVSVKTTTAWSKKGSGSPVKADRGHWKILAAVYLGKDLFPTKLAIVPLHRLLKKDVFVKNAANRSHTRKAKRTQAHPPFRWWPWLDDYLVRFEIKNGDMELLP
jgi:hypothetical protein